MRHDYWRSALVATLLARVREPFVFGRHDCCLLPAECIDAMTGSRHVEALGAEYQGPKSARQFIERCGGLAQAVSRFLGQPATARARTGDCAMFCNERGELTCGIIFGPIVIGPASVGLTWVWRSRVLRHWAI